MYTSQANLPAGIDRTMGNAMTRSTVCALLLSFAPIAGASSPDVQAPPPAPHCFSARDVQDVQQSDPQTLALRLGDGALYRLELAESCPDAIRVQHLQLTSRQGWICGSNEEILDTGGRRCAIAGLARIDAREYAEHAKRSDRQYRNVATLETLEVRGKRRHGFGGTTDYCLDARYMRGWSEDNGNLIVEMSPKRSGGNRYYRVELGGSCSEMSLSNHMQLVSGVGTTAICGNAGDRVVFMRDENIGGVLRPRAEGALAAQYGCAIRLVYPLLPDEDSE